MECLRRRARLDYVCVIASNEQNMQMIFDYISGCIRKYGMKVS